MSWAWQLIAGLAQAQQSSTRAQTTANRVKLMVQELEEQPGLTRSDILARVYVKSGAVLANDGTKVFIASLFYFNSFELNWVFFDALKYVPFHLSFI